MLSPAYKIKSVWPFYNTLVMLCLISVNSAFPQMNFYADSTKPKPDYRNHINIPEYDASLMPLKTLRSGTGVWTELNPKVPRVDYLGIHFINKDTGWACGANGALIKSTDGGQCWLTINSNTATPILKVRSYNGQIVIASGYNGLLLRSTNGGVTFTQIVSGVTGDLWGLQILNDTLGWACGNRNSLIRTTDAGLTWQKILTSGYTSDYWWIDFLTEKYGFIAANGKVLRTTDVGDNWEIIQAGDNQPLFCFDAIDSLHMAAAGYGGTSYRGKNIYSSDGGYTWTNGGPLTFEAVNCIQYVNPDTGYLVMNEAGLWKTIDQGQSWTIAQGIGEFEIQLFADENIGYNAGSGLKIYKANGDLDTWTKKIINDNLVDVYFTNESNGYTIGNRVVYKTTNSGENWFSLSSFPSDLFTGALGSIIFTDSLTGFAGGQPSRIVKTTDAGHNWYLTNRTGLDDTLGNINKIFFTNPTIGWVVTSRGGICKTSNGGESWFAQLNAGISVIFNSIYFIDSLYGWTANSNARPYKTTNAGYNWIQQTNINIGFSRDIYFLDSLNGFILESNKLYKTTDGGISWIQNQSLSGFGIAKFCAYGDGTIFIIGYKTYRSLNGGGNWDEFTELDNVSIKGLSLLNTGFGYAVGDLGLIMKYYDSTFVPVELISFRGESMNNSITLNWQTVSETNNHGFEIQRLEVRSQKTNWEVIGFVVGKGTTIELQFYSFIDKNLTTGKYQYRIKQIDFDGSIKYSDVINVEIETPSEFYLSQNYPNPFNPETTIEYKVAIKTFVNISLFDIKGEKVSELVNEEKQPAYYTIKLKGGTLSSGIYFYRMLSGSGYTAVKKLIIFK